MDRKTKNKLREIFNKHDPINIYFSKKVNFDEYDPEIGLVPKAFRTSNDKKEFIEKVYQIFITMFGKEIAGSKKRYEKLAQEAYVFLNAIKNDCNTK